MEERRSVRGFAFDHLVPRVGWLLEYRWGTHFARDVIGGIALAALLVPESLGYAGVAGVPAEFGLYAALASVIAYAAIGGVSILVVAPASAVAALSASLVAELSSDVDAVTMTAALALTSGVLLVIAGALRLGWIVNFISRPVLEAFVAGLSIAIIIGQLDGLLGFEVEGAFPLAGLMDAFAGLGEASGLTMMLGFGGIALLLVLEHWTERVPAAVVVVGLGIVLVWVFDLAAAGVAIVGDIPAGLPTIGVPDLSGMRWVELLGAGVALLLVGFSEGYAAASATAAGTGEEVDADRELMASGAANVASGLVGGIPVGGSLSKSAASEAAGARTQMANLVAGAIVLATLLFLAPVFERLPEPVLAAVVIVAVLRSADPRRLLAIRSVNRLDFFAGAVTFLLVLTWETLPALAVGVLLSLAFQIRRASFPDIIELSQGPDGVFHAVPPDVPSRDDVIVLRFEAPLIYANANGLRKAVRSRLRDRPSEADPVRRVVLVAEMWSVIDITGAEVLEQINDELATAGIELHLARLHSKSREQLARSGLFERFAGRIHPSIAAAVGGGGKRKGAGDAQ